jgi:kinesin family protein 3/17
VETGKNFKVVIRVRPPLPRELHGSTPFRNVVDVCDDEKSISLNDAMDGPSDDGPFAQYRFTFDHVYDPSSGQKEVYDTTAKAVVDSALAGYNATIFAYGQTGTGKTYTMEGHNLEGAGEGGGSAIEGRSGRAASPMPEPESRGIIPRAIEQIFQHISKHASPRMKFLVRASYLQIYNEVISDLLKPERTNLTIREDSKRGIFVDGLSEWVVRSPREIYGLMQRGAKIRATGSTKMNELSSRSHAVFIIIAEQSEVSFLRPDGESLSPEEFAALMSKTSNGRNTQQLAALEAEGHVRQSFKVGKLNLVDLAGSERVRTTKATGQRLEESKKINQSLSALGNVIAALTDTRGRQHIPYVAVVFRLPACQCLFGFAPPSWQRSTARCCCRAG